MITRKEIVLSRYEGILLDLHGTVMVDEDRLEDRAALVAHLRRDPAGAALDEERARVLFDEALDLMSTLYSDPVAWDSMPTLAEVFQRVAPDLAGQPDLLHVLVDTVALFERGRVPTGHAQAVLRLAETHRLGVVSNIWAPRDRWVEELDRAGILTCMDSLVFSSDGRVVKPRPAPFLRAARAMGLPPSALLVIGDDSLRDGYGARLAGMESLILGSEAAGRVRDLPELVARLTDRSVNGCTRERFVAF